MKKVLIMSAALILGGIFLVVFSNTTAAMDNSGKFGLTLGLSGGSSIGGIYYLNNNWELQPSISYDKDSGVDRSNLGFGIGVYRCIKLTKDNNMELYLGPKIVQDKISNNRQTTTSTSIAAVFGVQYMFKESIGILGDVSLEDYSISGDDGDDLYTTQSGLRVVFLF